MTKEQLIDLLNTELEEARTYPCEPDSHQEGWNDCLIYLLNQLN